MTGNTSLLDNEKTQIYGYRWVVLSAFMMINLVIQIQWLTMAPIRSAAMEFYGVSGGAVDFLSMAYMFVFLIFCIPASYVIDTYGIRIGIGIGSIIAAVAGLMKGIFADNYTIVLICQLGLAIAQPFVLNAVTAVTVRWFPLRERGMAAGLTALSQYLGIIIVMILTPVLVDVVYGDNLEILSVSGVESMLLIYGIATVVAAFCSLALIREKPPTSPEIETIERHKFTDGIRYILTQKNMLLLMVLFFIGLGIFNAISTMIDAICLEKGLTVDQSGLVGGLMLIGGVIGAVILPFLSDKFRKRKIFLVICMAGMVPAVAGLTFFQGYGLTLTASFILGFFVMSAGPIGFQYAAEVSFPAPESTSQGLILLVGQISGLAFVAGMATPAGLKNFMIVFIVISVIGLFGSTFLGESPMIITEDDKAKGKSAAGSLL
ncbi:MFS transporter [Desulfobacula sp.]